jgi:hypothetical protein
MNRMNTGRNPKQIFTLTAKITKINWTFSEEMGRKCGTVISHLA